MRFAYIITSESKRFLSPIPVMEIGELGAKPQKIFETEPFQC